MKMHGPGNIKKFDFDLGRNSLAGGELVSCGSGWGQGGNSCEKVKIIPVGYFLTG
jgi:hypothetical protein